MTDLLLLALGASLVNNFVLTNFLGLCPFVGVSRRFGPRPAWRSRRFSC